MDYKDIGIFLNHIINDFEMMCLFLWSVKRLRLLTFYLLVEMVTFSYLNSKEAILH